jgi:mono/diheme cytochrome c family protein
MNLLVLGGIGVAMVLLRLARIPILGWLVAWWAGAFIAVRYGIEPPLPASIVNLFMGIISLALLTYVFSDSVRLANAKRPLVRFMVEKQHSIPLSVIVVFLPALVAFRVYLAMSGEVMAPGTGRTIHPAPPATIGFKGRAIDLVGGSNPYRELETKDPAAFREHLAQGRRVYYQNCVFCHGDNMKGDGVFAHALDPIPANLADPTTIAMLQETYLFWRIAKGGPGLPEESTPWASAMPAWEQLLTEDEIWDVILYMYEHTGLRPRAREIAE